MNAYQSAAVDRFFFRLSMALIWLVIIGLALYSEGIIR
jgi:hypothetical protein